MQHHVAAILMTLVLAGCSTDPPNRAADVGNTPTDSDAPARQKSSDEQTPAATASPETWDHATERQRMRAVRSFRDLAVRGVPALSGPLFVDDDEQVRLQSPQEVARRTLVLWAVELRAEGIPQEEALGLINQLDLWDSVSPEEKRFLQDANPDPDESQGLVWRLESIWVLLWALGHIEELDWPSGMCDVPKVVEILKPQEANPKFIAEAKLRSKAEILDAQDLIMRIHWSIRDAHLNQGGMIPEDLIWSGDSQMVHVGRSAAVGVVEERHYVLNWLVNFLDPKDWDHVDTPT